MVDTRMSMKEEEHHPQQPLDNDEGNIRDGEGKGVGVGKGGAEGEGNGALLHTS